MRVAVTGAYGFLGWHTRARHHALHGVDALPLGRDDFADVDGLVTALRNIDVVVHIAGVNRAASDALLEHGNVVIARMLAQAMRIADVSLHVVNANSIQSLRDTPYGRGKRKAGEILAQAAAATHSSFADVYLPNLFGEHGRPHYNSFVATFCSNAVEGRESTVTDDREIPLLHAQAAADVLLTAAFRHEDHQVWPPGERHLISEVHDTIQGFHATYSRGQIPALPDRFALDLFNTYRSYLFPQAFPFGVEVSSDARGDLFEAVRVHGSTGQVFASTTMPGMTRGEHFHLSKIERFFVVSGTAMISLRKVLDDEVVRFQVKGEDRAYVDMPTLWVHNITNVGDDELVMLSWADQPLDPAAPDTYRERVVPGGAA
ncbi:MAG TPA: NAD-dependent epimerase/dehydratase family protein [Nocardioidaceae bacterium]|nr:NAD-dependent epimerase/dehydratase family protein [Nocardioidaceae bacterium]